MRTLLLAICTILFFSDSFAQTTKIKNKKYPSLLWEITGKGMKKPSYLFGTMHVSSKMVFHLSDSFYLGIKNADVVALETNPGTWQDDFSRYDLESNPYSYSMRNQTGYNPPSDFLSINTLKAYPYEKLLEQALYTNPSMINSFLYRTNSESSSDFEEDTYLDLYIYQVGRKWNKKLSGVEDFDESMNLVKEAYSDAAKDKNKNERNYDIDREFSFAKLEEAYRTGDLDLIDTIQKLNSVSTAFDEKFLYKRNEVQARNIDSIIKSKQSLFVGVGAAHLPGQRGVIEMLRAMGYKLRPIKMNERDSRHKDEIEQIRVPVGFSTRASEDGFYSVNLPGKLYNFGSQELTQLQQQHADMSNGSYYIVSRIPTNASLWGHSTEEVYRKVDSLLYENIPGKMLSREKITRNGYPGFDILNKTRRGDFQRYNIFVTPHEVIIFKMSGTGEYVKLGKEATQFFSSIQLKEIKTEWKKYIPPMGGFEVELPHQPVIQKTLNWNFIANDKTDKTSYQVIRTDINNTKFAEEDSFDLNLMEESFSSSEFIDKSIYLRHTKHKGYAALDAKYAYKNGDVALVRYIIQGPHYYTLVATAAKEHSKMSQFIQSFSIKPFIYGVAQQQRDTVLHFTVTSPVLINKPKKLDMYPENVFRLGNNNEDESHLEEYGQYKDRIIKNDSTGEKIFVSLYKPGKYYFDDDTAQAIDTLVFKTKDQDWVYRSRKKYEMPNKTKVLEYTLGDPKSSRMVVGKSFSRNGIYHRVVLQADTLTGLSGFASAFMASYMPVDTLKGVNPLEKKTHIFFADFHSKDTLDHKRAIKNIEMIELDSSDFTELKKAVQSLNWSEKKYLDVKNSFVRKFSSIPTKASANFLKEIYFAAGDTVDLQYAALEALLDHQNSYSFQVFRDIMINEPPVLDLNEGGYNNDNNYGYGKRDFMSRLSDSLLLTKQIFKDLLPLININDYEKPMMSLLETMVDSNMVTAKDYEIYLPKFLIETKQELKKQVISEKNKSIEQAQKDPEDKRGNGYNDEDSKDYGNNKLNTYATILMPFWDINPAVQQPILLMLNSSDKRLKMNTAILMLKNNKPVPDTMLKYFAAMDLYRYELYSVLKNMKRTDLFPSAFNNHIDLAKSELMDVNSYNPPDTFVFLASYPVRYKNNDGLIYFFKYKKKKDENGWKIATAGLVPKDPKSYEFDEIQPVDEDDEPDLFFTDLTSVKFDLEETLDAQLQKILKRKLYAKRKSAAEFYEDDEENDNPNYFRFKD
jgi:uncharacterized protein YbaP (TraB family)